MTQTKRHKVFISYYHDEDQEWKDRFVQMMGNRIVDRSVVLGDIVDTYAPTDDTLRRIREEHISEATVTVVLVGPCTWQRKFVDWEIGATLRDTNMNPRCGLLGILLPDHPNYGKPRYNPHLIPPRLADNVGGADSFACIYNWPGNRQVGRADNVQNWIHQAFKRRKRQPDPNIGRHPFGRNWNRPCNQGWQEG